MFLVLDLVPTRSSEFFFIRISFFLLMFQRIYSSTMYKSLKIKNSLIIRKISKALTVASCRHNLNPKQTQYLVFAIMKFRGHFWHLPL